jgi:hypothetical protein
MRCAYEIKTEMNRIGYDAKSVRLKGLETMRCGMHWPLNGVLCVNKNTNNTNWSIEFAEQWNKNNQNYVSRERWYVEPRDENTILFVKRFHNSTEDFQTIELEEIA